MFISPPFIKTYLAEKVKRSIKVGDFNSKYNQLKYDQVSLSKYLQSPQSCAHTWRKLLLCLIFSCIVKSRRLHTFKHLEK